VSALPNRARQWITSRLSRVTTSGQFVPEIDGLRFFAITAVVIYHINNYLREHLTAQGIATDGRLASFLAQGKFGVQMFFVISGMVLGLPFASRWLEGGKRVSLRRYFLRRLTRLEPPYLINIVFCYAVKVLFAGGALALLPSLLASSVYLHGQVFGETSFVSAVTWSLEIEVQFYILAPLLGTVFAIRNATSRRSTLVAGIVLGGLYPAFGTFNERFYLSLGYHISYFLTGFLLTDLYLVAWKRRPVKDWRWDLVGVGAGAVAIAVSFNPVTRPLIMPLAILAVYCAAFRGARFNALVQWKPLPLIGGMCYTIYLYHASIIKLLSLRSYSITAGMAYPAQLAIQIALMILPVLIASSILFALIERPCMIPDWPARLRARLTRAPSEPMTEPATTA